VGHVDNFAVKITFCIIITIPVLFLMLFCLIKLLQNYKLKKAEAKEELDILEQKGVITRKKRRKNG
jgi:heme/copper-type cytochrome/quinol oxidase subunit 2